MSYPFLYCRAGEGSRSDGRISQYLGATGEMEEQWLVRVPAGTAVVVRVWDSLKEVYSEPAVIRTSHISSLY